MDARNVERPHVACRPLSGGRSALWLPIVDDLAEPAVVARLAAEAEEAGWHGVFVWDHLRRRAPVRRVADPPPPPNAFGSAPWSHPLPAADRPRPPGKPRRRTGSAVAGSAVAGSAVASVSAATGEELEDLRRGQMLEKSLEILAAAWSGMPVHHHSRHHTLDGISFLPRPVQRHDGFFPVDLEHPDRHRVDIDIDIERIW